MKQMVDVGLLDRREEKVIKYKALEASAHAQ